MNHRVWHIKQKAIGLWLRIRYPQLRNAFAIASHLTLQERIALYRLAQSAKVIAEIGSYVGASACCFGAARKEDGVGQVICIDTWNNDSMSEGSRDTWHEFESNTKDYRAYLLPIRGLSTEVVSQVREMTPSLDLLFVDGDHSYAGVKADWEAYKNFLTPDSIVVFHDSGWATGVQRVINEDAMPLVDDHNSLPNIWWGTIRKAP